MEWWGLIIGAGLPSLIIPVHNAPAELNRCLASVCATVPAGAEVFVIDDASTDAEVTKVLGRWQQRTGPSWRFCFQQQNLGFVATANRGMEMTRRDVVLLAMGLAGLLVFQILLGAVTIWTRSELVVTTAHVGVGALMLATCVVLLLRVYSGSPESGEGAGVVDS